MTLTHQIPLNIKSQRVKFKSSIKAIARPFLLGLGLVFVLMTSQAHAQFQKKSWAITIQAPEINDTDLAGITWNNEQLKNKKVILNFWATWCAPCLEELPSLQTLFEISDYKEVAILTINVKETKNKVQSFVSSHGLSFPVILDRQGDIAKKWGVRIYPTTILISSQGKPQWVVEGSVDWTNSTTASWIQQMK